MLNDTRGRSPPTAEQPPNRAQLAACNLPLKKGDVVKFFTGYPDMCDICDALKDKELLGENKVTMARNAQGNFTEYLFT